MATSTPTETLVQVKERLEWSLLHLEIIQRGIGSQSTPIPLSGPHWHHHHPVADHDLHLNRPAWLVPSSYVGLTVLSGGLCRTALIQTSVVAIFRFGLGCMGVDTAALREQPEEEARKLLVFACAMNALATYILSPGLSVWGQSMCGGYQNRGPSHWNSC